jgi:catechol 2,3-dioxygenase-like lactoylglutathione lyase family enzyme
MSIQTFDHTGFVVEDIPRAHQFYGALFAAKPLHIANLKTRAYSGWPIISFVQMGLRRFELCLAQHSLPTADFGHPVPRIGFAVPAELMSSLPATLAALDVTVTSAPAFPDGLGIGECLRLVDPDGNVLELATWERQSSTDGVAPDAKVPVTDMCHVSFEVTDLAVAEKFYTEALGMKVLHQDAGELGNGRLILENAAGQLLLLEAVTELSPRSQFCGPFRETAPDFGGAKPYAGAHMALSVTDTEKYDEVAANLRSWGVLTDGDIRANERRPGEKSEYFYDPAGNRLQLIILGA